MWFPFYCPVIIIIWSMKTERGKSEPVCKSQCDQSGVVCCVQCTVQPVITCVACTVCTVTTVRVYSAQCTHHRLLHPSEPAPVQRSVLGSLLSQGVAVTELPYSVMITDPSVVTLWPLRWPLWCVTHWHTYPGDVVNWCQVARLCSFITSALTSGHLC